MGNLSANKLGGFAIIVGPLLALVFFFLQPGGPIIDTADPANGGLTISAMVSNSSLGQVTSVVIPIGLLIFLFGIKVVQGNVSASGNGNALARLGVHFITFGIIGWVIGSGLTLAITGSGMPADQAGAFSGSLYSATLGIGTVAGILVGIGFLALALGISTREDQNKIAALIAAVAAVVAIVVTIVGGLDTSQLQTMSYFTGIVYLIHTGWSIMLGLDLLKKT